MWTKEESEMNVLVAFATRHGATREIAQRIASVLEQNGLQVALRPVETVDDACVERADAFVLGAAAYTGHWLAAMTNFVRRHAGVLTNRPVYLFSSGPIGDDRYDDKGRDVVELSRPDEFDEFDESLRPRDLRVFFGVFDPARTPIGLMERIGALFLRLPAIRNAMPTGDFRDWPSIEAWAQEIATRLSNPEATQGPVAAAGGVS